MAGEEAARRGREDAEAEAKMAGATPKKAPFSALRPEARAQFMAMAASDAHGEAQSTKSPQKLAEDLAAQWSDPSGAEPSLAKAKRSPWRKLARKA